MSKKLRLEFETKNEILNSKFKFISPYEYYEKIFNMPLDKIEGCYIRENGDPKINKFYDMNDLFSEIEQTGYNDIYMSYCSFFNNYPKTDLAKELHAFVLDVDNVSLKQLSSIIGYINSQHLRPNYIINSGRGLHLVFLLTEPFQFYKSTKKYIYEIQKKLRLIYKKIDNNIKIDSLRPTQQYRIVGSRTKLDQISKVYEITERKTDILELAKYCKVDLHFKPYNYNKDNPIKAKDINRKASLEKDYKYGVYHKFVNINWYKKTLEKVYNEVSEGFRYTSLFALVVIAKKCNYDMIDLENDLEELVMFWNKSSINSKRVKLNEIEKALKGYNDKALLMKRETLEELLGFEFRCKNKRSRKEHLSYIRKVKELKVKDKYKKIKKEIIRYYLMGFRKGIDILQNLSIKIGKTQFYKFYKSIKHYIEKNMKAWLNEKRQIISIEEITDEVYRMICKTPEFVSKE